MIVLQALLPFWTEQVMRVTRALGGVVGAVIGLVIAVIVGKEIQRCRRAQQVDELGRTAATDRPEVFRADELEGVPDPVRDYFTTVLRDGQQFVGSVRLEQEGELRPGDADSAWKSFVATQYITTDPPGFFWNARLRLWPLISLRIGDLYRDGAGSASISLWGFIPIAGDDANPELNEGELLRYLAEAVWYPTALLPSEGVRWDAIDDSTATATLEYGETTATLTFHFTEDNEVAKVHAERPRRVADGYEPTPWTGRWHDYEMRNGIRVPTAGEVVWHLPDGDMEAWRGRVTDISYDEWR